MLKIVNCAETEKLKETMVEPQVEQAGDHQYPPGSPTKTIYNMFDIVVEVVWVLNFRSRFEALNDVFWENGEQHGSID